MKMKIFNIGGTLMREWKNGKKELLLPKKLKQLDYEKETRTEDGHDHARHPVDL